MRKKNYVLLLLVAVLVSAGCATGHDLGRATDIVRTVEGVYNTTPPIYDALYAAHPEWKVTLETLDAELHNAIETAIDTLIAVKTGTKTYAEFQISINAIRDILHRYGVDQKLYDDPKLGPILRMIDGYLGGI